MDEAAELDEIVAEFLVESHDNLDQLDRDLVVLEQDPSSRDLQAGVFRAVHTLKGTSALLGFERLASLAHVTETLLVRLREGRATVTGELVDVLLQTVDTARRLLAAIESGCGEDDVEVADVMARTERLVAACPQARAVLEERPLGAVLVESGLATPDAVGAALAAQLAGDPRPLGEILVGWGAVTRGALDDVLGQQRRRGVDTTVRVETDLLDQLLDVVGDLTATRDELLRHVGPASGTDLRRAAHRLDLLTRELAEGVAATRRQRVDQLWSKMPRLVRDLSAQCGKQVRLETLGGHVELDRTLLDAVRDPLTHLVRNAVDHGVEDPAGRAAAGKDAVGTVLLYAALTDGLLVLEVTDDGAGVDPAAVGAAALARGLVSPERLPRMTDAEVQQLVLAPGFSTAAAVTSVSGRGVGLDVVRTNVERAGGSVEVESATGAGTTCRLVLPATSSGGPGPGGPAGGPVAGRHAATRTPAGAR